MIKNGQTWTLFIFGMSGDLAKRKLIPALYKLFQTGKTTGHTFTIIGIGHDASTVETIIKNAKPFIEKIDEETLSAFIASCSYHVMDFDNPERFTDFAQNLRDNKDALALNRIAYMAVPAEYFCSLTKAITKEGLLEKGNSQHRIVYEKPFGWDRNSAREINDCIGQILDKNQVYHVDHYLTKTLVSNIILMRFSNIIFEPVWNHEYIDHVEIILDESIGIGDRGSYYDQYGALKDVVQNHMLQMLALVAMEEPKSVNDEDIEERKTEILKLVKVQEVILGQYEGYQQERAVNPQTTTETFVACKLTIDHPRWLTVPFYIRTGKYLNQKLTTIIITFKKMKSCFIKESNSCAPNVLTITMSPDEGFRLLLNAKKPHSIDEVTTVSMDFCYSCLFGAETTQAYITLLQSIFAGDHSISVSSQEIDYQWSIIDAIKARNCPILPYKKGSHGPEAALKLLPQKGDV